MSAGPQGSAGPRAQPSCAGSSSTTPTATTSSTTRRSGTTSTTRCSTSCARSRREHPELLTPDSPTQRVGGEPVGQPREGPPPRSRCSRSRNARSEEELRAWVAAHAQPPRARGHRGPELPRTSPSRRSTASRSRCIYRDGVLERGATRGNGEIGEDVTHNLRTIGVDPAARSTDAPPLLEVRGEVYMSLAGLRRAQRAPRRGGRVDVHEPAQLGRRHDPPARPDSSRPSARCRSGAYGVGAADGLAFATPLGGARRGCASTASASTATSSCSSSEDEVVGAVPGLAGAPRRARLRDRRRGREGRRRSSCSAASAWSAATRAGRSPGSSRRRRSHDAARTSSGTSASSATCTRSPCSSRSTSAA